MLFHQLYLTLLLSTLAAALPLEILSKPRQIVPRAQSYAIVNVDGGSSTAAPPQTSTVVEDQTKTKTLKVTDKTTATATATIEPPPALITSSTISTPTISSTKSTLSTSQLPSTTAAPSVVTVIITETKGPTQYYDNGLWHTSYAIRTFEAVTTAWPSSTTAVAAEPASW